MTLSIGQDQFRVTTSHPFWVVTGEDLDQRPRPEHVDHLAAPTQTTGRWVDSEHLRAGDTILTRSGNAVRLDAVEALDVAHFRVYNFTVGELHCYAVGDAGVLVHNAEEPCRYDSSKWSEKKIEGYNYGKYLRDKLKDDAFGKSGPDPTWTFYHAHHILPKVGIHFADEIKTLQDQLRKYGIDPITSRENLMWAPKKGHTKEYEKFVVDTLKKTLADGLSKGASNEEMSAAITKALLEGGKRFLKGQD